MSKKISQESYNEVVTENMEEFSMSKEEAIEDAIKQFEAQGVDLTNIIKDLSVSNADNTVIANALKTLEELTKAKSTNKDAYVNELNNIKTVCDKSLAQRVAVGNAKAYDGILNVMLAFEEDSEMTIACLKTMISLMSGQPDLLNSAGIELMLRYFDQQKNDEVLQLVLKWIKECCVKHEQNRQDIFNANILNNLKALLNDANSAILRGVCSVLRSLVLDDDVRVEFGKAHEHARIIASDNLNPILALLDRFKEDELVVSELLLTLSALIVRNEYCTTVENAGGVDFVLEVLKNFRTNEKLNRQALKLIKVLAGNDDCKAHIVQKNAAEVIANSMNTHKSSAQVSNFGLNAVAALTLRSPENSKIFFEGGFPEIIIEVMKQHPNEASVQKSGSWAIRNMVSRSRYQSDRFIALGVEIVLQEALKKFRKEFEYDLKAALRDLGCKVDLKEEWTGKGGKITTQAKIAASEENENEN